MTELGVQNPGQEKEIRRIKLKRPPEKLYYSISEIGEMVTVPPYVLRFWEKEFPTLRPKKNRAGNRTYQRKDIEQVVRIRDLLYKEGYTILGARHKMKCDRGPNECAARAEGTEAAPAGDSCQQLRRELHEIRREVEELLELFS